MTDTVTKLMALADGYALQEKFDYQNAMNGKPTEAAPTHRQVLQDELVKLLTPLTDEQIERMSKVGPVYAPNGWVERRPNEYRREMEDARASGIRIAEAAHGITGESK